MATKSKALQVASTKSTNIVNIADALAREVASLAGRVAPPSGNSIRITQDKQFIMPDGTKTHGPIEVVIVDFTNKNTFYPGAYNKDNIVPPACFAIGSITKDMVPSPNSPEVQSSSCASCPMNEWGSSGKGKACKNTVLLAVLPPDADADTPLMTLSVSPTAVKGFGGYVSEVARKFNLPPVGVITSVSFDTNVDYAQLRFDNPAPNGNINECFARRDEAKALLAVEPDVSNFDAKPAKKPAARGAARR